MPSGTVLNPTLTIFFLETYLLRFALSFELFNTWRMIQMYVIYCLDQTIRRQYFQFSLDTKSPEW